tara:strand:+ start:183 stop:626 length:444 start_codon:yes stop_codon:yes gene_type:complete
MENMGTFKHDCTDYLEFDHGESGGWSVVIKCVKCKQKWFPQWMVNDRMSEYKESAIAYRDEYKRAADILESIKAQMTSCPYCAWTVDCTGEHVCRLAKFKKLEYGEKPQRDYVCRPEYITAMDRKKDVPELLKDLETCINNLIKKYL